MKKPYFSCIYKNKRDKAFAISVAEQGEFCTNHRSPEAGRTPRRHDVQVESPGSLEPGSSWGRTLTTPCRCCQAVRALLQVHQHCAPCWQNKPGGWRAALVSLASASTLVPGWLGGSLTIWGGQTRRPPGPFSAHVV